MVHFLGTLRTDLRLAGAGFFFDFDGADFMGAGVFALPFDERLLVLFLVDDLVPLVLLLDRPGAFFVVAARVLAGLAFAGLFLVDDPARARLAAALVPANTVSRAGSPCLSGST